MSKATRASFATATEYELVTLQHSIHAPRRGSPTTFDFNSGPVESKNGGYRITKDLNGFVHVLCLVTGTHIELSPANIKALWRKTPKKFERVVDPESGDVSYLADCVEVHRVAPTEKAPEEVAAP